AETLTNRGNTLQQLKRFDEALGSYDQALALREDYPAAHWNRALLRLLLGDWRQGWQNYEWRWKIDSAAAARRRNFPQPLWSGSEPVAGKTILLHSEQGFGDTIQFCRFVPLLHARGARVILEVPEPLQQLMTSLAGAPQVVTKGAALPGFDLHC